jgi:hypothetical protein
VQQIRLPLMVTGERSDAILERSDDGEGGAVIRLLHGAVQ